MSDPAQFAAATPRLSLPYLYAGQAQKEFTVNECLARIDIMLNPAVVAETAAAPAEPAAGDAFLVASGAVGAFSGEDGKIASWDGQQWTFLQPTPGMLLSDMATGSFAVFRNEWERLDAPPPVSGGTTIDTEAREAIASLVGSLRAFGIFS